MTVIMKKSEIRKDYLFDKYVIISPGRALRPREFNEKKKEPIGKSPFTPDQIKSSVIIDAIGRGDKRVVAIPNIFPVVTPNNAKAYGRHEVIIETPKPNVPLSDLSLEQIENVLAMYVRRTRALIKKKKIAYVLCLKNEGVNSGASIRHAHSQILALGLLPPDLIEEAKRAAEYKKIKGSDFYSDVIKMEMKSPRRIFDNEYFAVFSPYASAYHYEAWIFSKRPADNISRLSKKELSSLAVILKRILKKLDDLGISYNYFCHQVISDRRQHFCIKIQPRDSVWGGLELGSGLVVNSIPPEEAAKEYRKLFQKSKKIANIKRFFSIL